jgi:hypothetical protein
MHAGHEKLIRIFDLVEPNREPVIVKGIPDKIRNVTFHQGDSLLLVSYSDLPNIRCAFPSLGSISYYTAQTLNVQL